jgi:branched-chain amino acid transport system permease protein
VAAEASTPVLSRITSKRLSPIDIIGLLLVGVLIFWLVKNFTLAPSYFCEIFLIGIVNGCVYALIALGYTLVYGILELINFAHGDVFMLGSMFAVTFVGPLGLTAGSAWLWPGIVLLILISAVFCAVINASVEIIAYRPLRNAPRVAPLITAIGMSFILEDIALLWKGTSQISFPSLLPTGVAFSVAGIDVHWDKLIVIFLTVPLLLLLLWLVQRTKQGKAMRAVAQDRDASAIMGINVNRTISFTFLIAGALAGAAGVLYALYVTQVYYLQGFQLGLISFTAAVLGGIGNLPGAVLGAIIIGCIQAFNEGLSWHAPGSDWTEAIVFSILILILVFRPEGLLGERTPEGG